MKIELCGGKTKCKECKVYMKKGEIRGVYGRGCFGDPYVYNCINCFKKKDFDINQLIKIYKKVIKQYQLKINNLKKLKKLI